MVFVIGIVQQLNMYIVGGVVVVVQLLMQIVFEDGEIEIEVWLENKDVGFVEIGQEVEVKIDVFDYIKYGIVLVRVVYVLCDVIQDEKKGLVYFVCIVLMCDKFNVDGCSLLLLVGLLVNVGIWIGSWCVIEYVLLLLLWYQKEVLYEC